jgi:hypothetical protein
VHGQNPRLLSHHQIPLQLAARMLDAALLIFDGHIEADNLAILCALASISQGGHDD